MDKVYSISLEVFEGPLDLLIHLIEEERINIYDIPIAKITAQYLEYLEFMESLNFTLLGDYMVMLATLLEIKSRMLLPKPESPCSDIHLDEGEDPREELTRRLLEYQKYKNSICALKERERTFIEIFSSRRHYPNIFQWFHDDFDSEEARCVSPESIELEEEDESEGKRPIGLDSGWIEEASLFDLLMAFQKIITRKGYKSPPEIIIDQDIPIGLRIDYILDQLEKSEKLEFSSLLEFLTDILDLVSMFLALLELIRLKRVKALQSQEFGTIYVLKTDSQNPNRKARNIFHGSGIN